MNLLAERFLKPSHPSHSINPHDMQLAWEKREPLLILSTYSLRPLCQNLAVLTLLWKLFIFIFTEMISQLPGVPTPKDLRAIKESVADKASQAKDVEFEEMCSFDLVGHIPFLCVQNPPLLLCCLSLAICTEKKETGCHIRSGI